MGVAEAAAGGVHGLGQCVGVRHQEGQLGGGGHFSQRGGAQRWAED